MSMLARAGFETVSVADSPSSDALPAPFLLKTVTVSS
jgi:hypothetical protein